MKDIVPRDLQATRMKRATRKEVARLNQEALAKRKALEVAATEARERLQANAALALAEALLNIKNGYDAAQYAGFRSTGLNHEIAYATRDNPGLELIQRTFEETAALAANMAVYRAGSGQ